MLMYELNLPVAKVAIQTQPAAFGMLKITTSLWQCRNTGPWHHP